MKESVEDFLVQHSEKLALIDSASQVLLFSVNGTMGFNSLRDVTSFPEHEQETLRQASSDATRFFHEAGRVAAGEKLVKPPVFALTRESLKDSIEVVYNLLDSKKEDGKQARGELQAAYKAMGFEGKIPEMTVVDVLEKSTALYHKDVPQVQTVDEGTAKPAAMTASKHK